MSVTKIVFSEKRSMLSIFKELPDWEQKVYLTTSSENEGIVTWFLPCVLDFRTEIVYGELHSSNAARNMYIAHRKIESNLWRRMYILDERHRVWWGRQEIFDRIRAKIVTGQLITKYDLYESDKVRRHRQKASAIGNARYDRF